MRQMEQEESGSKVSQIPVRVALPENSPEKSMTRNRTIKALANGGAVTKERKWFS